MLAGSNIVGSLISLMSNFLAGGLLIALLSPFNFIQGVFIVALGVLLYTLWSGFRASVLTDFVQLIGMLGAVAVLCRSSSLRRGSGSLRIRGRQPYC